MSILHSFTPYAKPTRIQVPTVPSSPIIKAERVLRLVLTHSTSVKYQHIIKKKKKMHEVSFLFDYLSVSLSEHSLKTEEMILIPAIDNPVKNLMMTNIMYETEKALSSAKNMVDK